MIAYVTLRRRSDGLVVTVTDEYKNDAVGVWREKIEWEPHNAIFQWTDGNYGCDCNRHLFFERQLGQKTEDQLDEDNTPCGNNLLYEMLSIEVDDTVVWRCTP